MTRVRVYFLLGIILIGLLAITGAISANDSSSDPPQSLVDQLAGAGFSYLDIVDAYTLSLYLNSPAVALAEFKPAELSWEEYGAALKTYLRLRQAMSEIDQDGSYEGIDITEVKIALLLLDYPVQSSTLALLAANGLTPEESIGILTIATVRGLSEKQLVAMVAESPVEQADGKAGLRQLLAALDALVALV